MNLLIKRVTIFALVFATFFGLLNQVGQANYAGGGTGYFSDGGYASKYTTFYYEVSNAPPNMCGTLHIRRNGGPDEVTPNWICTDLGGLARKGPYTADADEIATDIYIQWTNGTTTNVTRHVKDITKPTVTIKSLGGPGVPIPTTFNGTAKDNKYGTGFYDGVWSYVQGTFKNVGNGQYYDPWRGCYCAGGPVYIMGTITPAYGWDVSWSFPTPPASSHNSWDTYEWSVYIQDMFYSDYKQTTFSGPR